MGLSTLSRLAKRICGDDTVDTHAVDAVQKDLDEICHIIPSVVWGVCVESSGEVIAITGIGRPDDPERPRRIMEIQRTISAVPNLKKISSIHVTTVLGSRKRSAPTINSTSEYVSASAASHTQMSHDSEMDQVSHSIRDASLPLESSGSRGTARYVSSFDGVSHSMSSRAPQPLAVEENLGDIQSSRPSAPPIPSNESKSSILMGNISSLSKALAERHAGRGTNRQKELHGDLYQGNQLNLSKVNPNAIITHDNNSIMHVFGVRNIITIYEYNQICVIILSMIELEHGNSSIYTSDNAVKARLPLMDAHVSEVVATILLEKKKKS